MPRLSPEWSAIVGDILTNLRAALDHLAWQLLILDGQEPGRSTSFPFALDPANAIIKPRDWKKGDPGLRRRDLREEVERLQPYELAGQDGLLWWINELCNTDKHRELLIVGLFPDLNQVWWGGESKVRTYVNQPRVDGEWVLKFVFEGADPPNDFKPNVGGMIVVLDEGPAIVRTTPIQSTMSVTVDLVEDSIVGSFRHFFD